jgi:hypothetical protein
MYDIHSSIWMMMIISPFGQYLGGCGRALLRGVRRVHISAIPRIFLRGFPVIEDESA